MGNQGSIDFFAPHQSYFANRKDKRLGPLHQINFDVDKSDERIPYKKMFFSLIRGNSSTLERAICT